MTMRFRVLVQLVASVLPGAMRNRALNRWLGWQIDAAASISRLALVLADVVVMRAGTSIGALTVVKGLSRVELDEHSLIGRLNWISAYPLSLRDSFSHVAARRTELILGAHSAITNRHLIDCTDQVTLGKFATFAGFRSQVLTHSIDVAANRQNCRPVFIGDYAFIGTGAILLGGAHVEDFTVIAAGAVVVGRLEKPYALYAGAPARFVKDLPAESGYFNRLEGAVR